MLSDERIAEFLETRARVQADAQRWFAEDNNPDLLLPGGKRLAEAEDMLQTRCDEVGDRTAAYIDASIAAHRARDEAERAAERQRGRDEGGLTRRTEGRRRPGSRRGAAPRRG